MPNHREEQADEPTDVPRLEELESPPGSPPQNGSMSHLMELQNCVSNLSLAHEIVVNQDFRFKSSSPPKDSLEGRVAEMVHRAFWDVLREQLESSPPDHRQAVPLLREVKTMLLSLLLPAHVGLRAQLDRVLDLELIQQQVDHGALDLQRLASFIASTMAGLCAPVRDPEIRALRLLTDPVDLFREVLRVLELMKKDMVNFTLLSLRPHLAQQAVPYERAKFQELLRREPGSLDHTTSWLQRAAQEQRAALPPGPPGSDPGGRGALSPSAVLNRAYMGLLHWDPQDQRYPETVLMDRDRLDTLGHRVDLLALQAAVLLLTSAQCGGAVLSLPGFVGKLKQTTAALLEGSQAREADLKGALQAVGEQVLVLVAPALEALDGPPLSRQGQDALRGQIADLWRPSNPIRTLIGFPAGDAGGRPPRQDGPAPPAVLGAQGPELEELGARFSRLVHFNRSVFGPRYAPVLRGLLFPPGGEEEGGEVGR
ncbi:unnamed protein product [Gadus morhua 'NCC']